MWRILRKITKQLIWPQLAGRVSWVNELYKLQALVPHFTYACANWNPLKTKSFNYGLKRKCQFCIFTSENDAKYQILRMVHQQSRLLKVILYEIKSLKNIFGHLVTLSIPKVVKNGQKVPILANFEIRLAAWA